MALSPKRIPRVTAADFHKDLTIIPGKEDLARKVNEQAVKESIRNLVLTNKGERPFQPQLGCDVRKMLFENIDAQTFDLIRTVITDTIEQYEPRCELLGVDVIGDTSSNSIDINIVFRLINTDTPTSFSIILNRIR
jgi:phage baseplate assembly protein W